MSAPQAKALASCWMANYVHQKLPARAGALLVCFVENYVALGRTANDPWRFIYAASVGIFVRGLIQTAIFSSLLAAYSPDHGILGECWLSD